MFTNITFTALVVATIASTTPVPGSQSTGETSTKAEDSAVQVWCSGPRQFTDFRCKP